MMNKYEKYKDSGIPWIGEIPQDWEVVPLGKLCRFKTGGTPPNKIGVNMESDGYPWITARDFSETYKFKNYSQYISENIDYDYPLFPPKSILMVCIASVGKLGIAEEYVYSNQQITALVFVDKYYSLFYLFFIESISCKIIADASSNVVPIINSKYLNEIKCIVPSLVEQRVIADFLDVKCAEVDELIALQQKMIDELKVYKQSVITEAVTKGLNPDAPLKDSGIEWIGQIPEYWEKGKLLYFAKLVLGKMLCTEPPSRQIYTTEKYLKSKNIGWLSLCIENDNVEEMWFSESEKEMYRLEKGDIVMNEGGEIGKVSLWIPQYYDCFIQNSVHKITPKEKCSAFYLVYLLFAMGKSGCFSTIVNQISIAHLTKEKLEKILILCPPIEEQQQIADYLDTKCAEIDEMTSIKQQKIEQLKEYKKSIIYEYVTGKKQVI